MSETNQCPQCGAELPASAPRGLCPACLLQRGLESNTGGYTNEGASTARWAPPGIEELAARFPELEITRLIGRGGMGAVYQARQKKLDRVVALKILPPEMGHDPAFAERFAREAQAMAKLNHPHIVAIHEFGERDGWYYFAMEYVDGLSLRGLLDSGHVAPKEALAIVPQICEALQYAHDQGIVHRDIKPENILLNKQGKVKIADFGLAKLMGRSPLPRGEGGGAAPPGEGSATVHQVLGTPQYMAPEQIDHPAEVDHRADIYSLGVVFYQMLTGELPVGRFAPPSRKVQIDVRLDEVVLRALEREPEKRYQQVSEVKTRVETITGTPRSVTSDGALEFTSEARRIMVHANEEARLFFHEYVGAEHILLALAAEPTARVAAVFERHGIAKTVVRRTVEALIKSGPDPVFPGKLPLTPRAREALDYASQEARSMGAPQIDAEHLLLGLLRNPEGVSGNALASLGLTLALVRADLEHQQAGEVKTQVETVAATAASTLTPPLPPLPTAGHAPPRSAHGPLFLFGLAYAGLILFVIGSRTWLPERVASHFGMEGQANDWMSRDFYLLFITAAPLVCAGLLCLVGGLLRVLLAEFVNVPRKDYWLAPEHRGEAVVLVRRHMLGMACLMTGFFGALHGLTLSANSVNPPHLSLGSLLIIVIVFLMAVIILITRLMTRFAEPGSGRVPPAALPLASLGAAQADADSQLLVRARHDVRGPAIGLLVTGILNWVSIPLLSLLLVPYAVRAGRMGPVPPLAIPVIMLFLSAFMIYGALKMTQLEGRGLAMWASIVAAIISPGNIIGLPIGIWALVVLSRREVREAFARAKPPPGAGGSTAPGAPTPPRHDLPIVIITRIIYALALLIAAVPLFVLGIDPGDPNHLVRFIGCPLVGLAVAVGGFLLGLFVRFLMVRTGYSVSTPRPLKPAKLLILVAAVFAGAYLAGSGADLLTRQTQPLSVDQAEEMLRNEIARQLADRSDRCSDLRVVLNSNSTFTVLFSNMEEMKGIDGRNVWTPIHGSLRGRSLGRGRWRVSGDGDLGAVQFDITTGDIAITSELGTAPVNGPPASATNVAAPQTQPSVPIVVAPVRTGHITWNQTEINDIQPDGTIHSQLTSDTGNLTGSTWTTFHFVNSDFIHLQKVTDSRGRPIPFTTKHNLEDRRYDYTLTLPEPVPPGQVFTMTCEGTVDTLIQPSGEPGEPGVFEYHMNHWPSIDGDTRRVEVHRLPRAAKLLEKSPNDLVESEKDGRVELRIDRIIPPKANLEIRYRYRLAPDAQPAHATTQTAAAPGAGAAVIPGADAPILVLALTSETYALSRIEDLSELRLAQKIAQLPGVGSVSSTARQRPPAVLMTIQRQPGADILATVGRIKALLPLLQAALPPAIDVSILTDRAATPTSQPAAPSAPSTGSGPSTQSATTRPWDHPEDPRDFPYDARAAGAKIEAAQIDNAAQHLKVVEQQYKAGMATALDYERAKWELTILKAQHSGDALRVAKARLEAAKEILDVVEPMWRAGVLSAKDYYAAEGEMLARQAEWDAIAPSTQPGSPPPPVGGGRR